MKFLFNPQITNTITPKIGFQSTTKASVTHTEPRKDSFNSNPLFDNYSDKIYLTKLIKSNPAITKILEENNIPININIDELEKLKKGHLLNTRIIAAKIYSALPNDIKSQINLMDLQQAAMLHDYGKILIPPKILNKTTPLTEQEKLIMELHSSLGAELLRQQGVKSEVADLVKYHHQNLNGTGYPKLDNHFNYSYDAQIISIADKFSALTEKRCYKNPISKNEALQILYQDVIDGNYSKEIYDALLKIT